MYFDHESVRSGSHGCFRHRLYEPPFPSGVARVYDNGEMGFLAQHGDALEIKSVPCVSLECADAALAEDDVLVSGRHDILCGHDPFLIGGVEAALQKDRAVELSELLEQVEVLHVAGADLDEIHFFVEYVQVLR